MAAARRPAQGNGSPRAAGAERRAAETRAPKGIELLGSHSESPARRADGAASSGRAGDPPRPLGAQAASAAGQQRVSGRIISGFAALLRCLRLPLPSDADFAAPRKRLGPPSPQPGKGFLSERCLSSSAATFQSPKLQPPPVITPQANMAAAEAAALAVAA